MISIHESDPNGILKNRKENCQNYRKLTTERIYLSRPMTYVVMVFQVTGHISMEELKMALDRLTAKHRLLRVKIIIDESGNAYFSPKDVPEFQIDCITTTNDDEWKKQVEKLHMNLIDIFTGPLIRFSLIYNREKTYLIINSHHSISDGISLLYFGRDILEVIEAHNCSFQEDLPPIIDEKSVGKRFGTPLNRFLLKIVNKKWMDSMGDFRITRDLLNKIHVSYWSQKSHCRVLTWELNEKNTDQFIKKCKQEYVTVHTGIATALLLAQLRIMEDRKSYLNRFHMPVNIRNKLKVPVSNNLSFFALSIILKHKLRLNLPFWENARLLHKMIQKRFQKSKFWRLFTINLFDPNLLDSVYFQKYSLINNKYSKLLEKKMIPNEFVASLALTNLGIVNFNSNVGKFKIEAIYGPSVYSDILEKVFSVCTFNNKMFFTLTFEEKNVSTKLIEQIIDEMNSLIIKSL